LATKGSDEANRSAKLTHLKSEGIGAKRLPAGFIYAFSEMRVILLAKIQQFLPQVF
jgi:hypothetical protein